MATTAKIKPASLRIRAYQVGFGDCFLLTFKYPKATKKADHERHVLIDFGSTGMPGGINPTEQMMKVARDIEEVCSPKLHIVVATHRHKDHISGFTTREDGNGTGDVIAALKPNIVIQPWTEDPDAKDPKTKSTAGSSKGTKEKGLGANSQHLSSLRAMNYLAEAVGKEVANLSSAKFRQALGSDLAEQIEFLSEDNGLPNRSAVANLAGMGKNYYVNFGYKLNLSRLLPGVKIHVLGPPDIKQHANVQKQRSSDEDEFWMLNAAAERFWNLQSATGEMVTEFLADDVHLFPAADVYQDYYPSHDRWFVRRLRTLRGNQMLGLVRALDKAMNNTSVILLLEVGGKKFLFPGDAQIENWEYALNDPATAELLSDVYLYKVGHHGSRNATPRTLWKNFSHKGKKGEKSARLQTVISTMKGKHGHPKSHTEVPRSTLVTELENMSSYRTTEEAADKHKLFIDLEIPL
jgi:hypothetical protein